MARRGNITHGLGGIRSPVVHNQDRLTDRKPEPQPAPKPEPKPPMPGRVYDSTYTADTADIQNTYTQGLSGIATQRDRLGFDTGYTIAGEIDTRNPYSQAMALQKHWQESRRGTSVGMAARGQLYSGARKQALEQEDHRYSASDANLREYTRRGYEDLGTAEQNLNSVYGPGGTAYVRAGANQTTRWQDQERDWYSLYG